MVSVLAIWFSCAHPYEVTNETLTVGEVSRTYRLVCPHRSTSSIVIVALHGVGDTSESFAAASGLDIAAAEGATVVYPSGIRGSWRLDELGLPGEVAFLDAIVRDAANRSGIDDPTVAVVGMSRGGELAARYAVRSRYKVHAVGVHSAVPSFEEDEGTGPPMLLISGARDQQVSIDAVRRAAQRLADAGRDVELAVTDVGHEWDRRETPSVIDFVRR